MGLIDLRVTSCYSERVKTLDSLDHRLPPRQVDIPIVCVSQCEFNGRVVGEQSRTPLGFTTIQGLSNGRVK